MAWQDVTWYSLARRGVWCNTTKNNSWCDMAWRNVTWHRILWSASEDQPYVFSAFYTYFQVFQDRKGSNDGSIQKVAESILRFFSGFEAFKLPPPSSDPKVLENIARNKDKLTPAFLSGVQNFKPLLKSVLVAKRSFNDGDIVTGEGMYETFRASSDLFISTYLFSWKPLHQIEVTR